jgi:hypothetical protein
MASIPLSGVDLWVALSKIKEVAEMKHFCLPVCYYKTQKNCLVKEFGSPLNLGCGWIGMVSPPKP